MEKRILTLTICLALTASSAFASSTVTSTMKLTTNQAESAPCPCSVTPTAEVPLTKEQFMQKMEEKMAKHREALYCKLGLSVEQKTKAEELDAKNKADARPLMDKVQEERAKLTDLKAKKACSVKIMEQKQKLRDAKKALHKHFMASKKSFETILTKEQLTKFKTIKAENRTKMKKHCKCKGHCHHHDHFNMHELPADNK